MYDELINSLNICLENESSNLLMKKAADVIKMLSTEVAKYHHAAFIIGETCVEESKKHITPEDAIQKIRENRLKNEKSKFNLRCY